MTRPEAMRLCSDELYSYPTKDIHAHLRENGVHVSQATVRRWRDPDRAEQRRRRARDTARQRRQANRLFERISLLRSAGMSHRCIAILLKVDYGIDAGEDRIRYWLRVGRISSQCLRQASR